MNRFRFRFASVLRYREVIEENRKREFGAALDHQRHEEERLRRIDNSIEGHERQTEENLHGTISARDLQNRYNYARRLDNERENQQKNLDLALRDTEAHRKKLVDATKRKKIFERLRDRDRETHDQEIRKEEQSIIDELSTQRYTRTKQS